MNSEIIQKLEKIAYAKTIPFCYGCYQNAPTGCCSGCGSDDLMRLKKNSGCEYGVDWVIQELLSEKLESVNIEESFEESLRECYPEEITVGWMTLDAVSVMKEMDPVSWSIAMSEWEQTESDEGNIISFDNGTTYYWRSDLESFIAELGGA